MTDYVRVQQAIKEIVECETALKWLEEYGVKIGTRDDGATANIRFQFAAGCPGAEQAEKVVSSYARLAVPSLVETAIMSCRNTIAMAREAIAEEMAKPISEKP